MWQAVCLKDGDLSVCGHLELRLAILATVALGAVCYGATCEASQSLTFLSAGDVCAIHGSALDPVSRITSLVLTGDSRTLGLFSTKSFWLSQTPKDLSKSTCKESQNVRAFRKREGLGKPQLSNLRHERGNYVSMPPDSPVFCTSTPDCWPDQGLAYWVVLWQLDTSWSN